MAESPREPLRLSTVCAIDFARRLVLGPEGEVELTPMEADLLAYLATRLDQIVSHDDIFREVWKYHPDVESRAVYYTARRVRGKIEPDPAEPRHLLSVRGTGYRLTATTGTRPVARGDAPFVGRENELRDVRAALGRFPIVTLLGPGGVGKTRLALEVASTGGDGWRLVDLTSALTADAVVSVLLRALEERGTVSAATPKAIARELLQQGIGLLVLDNAERSVAALGPVVRAMIGEHSKLRCLVTSRQRLGLAEEGVIEVPGLDAAAASALLAEGLERVGITPDAATIQELVRATAGMPLALQLATARARAIGLAPLAKKIKGVLATLGDAAIERGGNRVTMRSVIGESVDALEPVTREALVQLACFPGTFDFEAAEAILGANALERVTELRDRSLVHRVDDRLSLYEVVKELVEERLAGRENPAAGAFVAHCVRLADALRDGGEHNALVVLAELPNFSRALALALQNKDSKSASALARTIGYHAARYGPARHGLEVVEAVLALGAHEVRERVRLSRLQARLVAQVHGRDAGIEAHTRLRSDADLLPHESDGLDLSLSLLYADAGRRDIAIPILERLSLSATLPELRASARLNLGLAYMYEGRLAEAEAHLSDSDVALPETDLYWRSARALVLALRGDVDAGRAILDAVLPAMEKSPFRASCANAFVNAARLELEAGATERARSYLARAEAIFGDLQESEHSMRGEAIRLVRARLAERA